MLSSQVLSSEGKDAQINRPASESSVIQLQKSAPEGHESQTKKIVTNHKMKADYSILFLTSIYLLGVLILIGAFFFLNSQVGISLGSKLIGGISSLIIVTILMILFSVSSIQKIGIEIKTIADNYLPLIKIISKITEHQLEQELYLQKYMNKRQRVDKDSFDSMGAKVYSEIKYGEEIVLNWLNNVHHEDEKKKITKKLDHLKDLGKRYQNFYKKTKEFLNILGNDSSANIESGYLKKMLIGIEKEASFLEHDLINFLEMVEEESNSVALNAKKYELNSESYLISAGIGIVVFGLLVLLMIWKASVGLVNNVKKAADSLSNSSGSISGSAVQFKDNSETLASMTQEQAAGIQEMMATLDEINAMTSRNSSQASDSAKKVEACKTGAGNGQRSLNDVMSAIEDINGANAVVMEQIEKNNTKISEISEIISEISTKTNVINDIVFQTKLLSFNASVEAARAGDQGKGFSVVAEEVGNLAAMSGTAANEISEMLIASTEKVKAIVDESSSQVERLIETSKEKVQTGLDKVNECNRIFSDVVTEITDVDGYISAIAMASKEQSDGVDAITAALREIDLATQQIVNVSQEGASASESLSLEADSLKKNSGKLIELVQSKSDT